MHSRQEILIPELDLETLVVALLKNLDHRFNHMDNIPALEELGQRLGATNPVQQPIKLNDFCSIPGATFAIERRADGSYQLSRFALYDVAARKAGKLDIVTVVTRAQHAAQHHPQDQVHTLAASAPRPAPASSSNAAIMARQRHQERLLTLHNSEGFGFGGPQPARAANNSPKRMFTIKEEDSSDESVEDGETFNNSAAGLGMKRPNG